MGKNQVSQRNLVFFLLWEFKPKPGLKKTRILAYSTITYGIFWTGFRRSSTINYQP